MISNFTRIFKFILFYADVHCQLNGNEKKHSLYNIRIQYKILCYLTTSPIMKKRGFFVHAIFLRKSSKKFYEKSLFASTFRDMISNALLFEQKIKCYQKVEESFELEPNCKSNLYRKRRGK